MITLGILFVGAILLYQAQCSGKESRELRLKYRLFALRDKLRDGAIAGKIDPHSWLFNYFDSTFSRTISVIGHLNLYALLFLRRSSAQGDVHILHNELDKAENPFAEEIIADYVEIVLDELFRRHHLFIFAARVATPLFAAVETLRNRVREGAEGLAVVPETSTFPIFVKRQHLAR